MVMDTYRLKKSKEGQWMVNWLFHGRVVDDWTVKNYRMGLSHGHCTYIKDFGINIKTGSIFNCSFGGVKGHQKHICDTGVDLFTIVSHDHNRYGIRYTSTTL